MMGLNLHNVVRGAITGIHPDETCTLYQSIGQRNIKGVVKSVYSEPKQIMANFQPSTDPLQHDDGKNTTPVHEKVYLYSDMDLPIMGIKRLPTLRTGDIIQRSDGTYWLITTLTEDWSWDGWACVDVNQQMVPPDFSASDWGDNDGS